MESEKFFYPNPFSQYAAACGLGAFGVTFVSRLFEDLSYVEAASLSGCALIPGSIGGLLGYSIFRILRKRQRIAIVAGIVVGAVAYALLVSVTSEPISQVLPFGANPSNPGKAALHAGISGGIAGLIIVWKSRRSEKSAT